MDQPFRFDKKQRSEAIKAFGSEKGINALEGIVQRYRNDCENQLAQGEIRDHLRDMRKHARALLRSTAFLSKKVGADAEWLTAPLKECEQYADKLLQYRFARHLKGGRPRHVAEAHLVQATSALWQAVHRKLPGRGRGPFRRLVVLMFRASGVLGAPTKYPEEIIAEVVPFRLELAIVGDDYPFASLEERDSLPALTRSAQFFFIRVLMAADGSARTTVISSGGGETGKEI